MLNETHCQIFDIPSFQFSVLKREYPALIPQIKQNHRTAWQDWKNFVEQISSELPLKYDLPHIERWCNGWQVRAHFFAFFKYQTYQADAPILSLILNQKRLTISLEWHAYKAHQSTTSLKNYHQWLDVLMDNSAEFADFDIWYDSEGEYAEYRTVGELGDDLADFLAVNQSKIDKDFVCIGKHILREDLASLDVKNWTIEQIERLTPLYESCFWNEN